SAASMYEQPGGRVVLGARCAGRVPSVERRLTSPMECVMRKWTLPVNPLLVRGERKWRSKGPLGLVGVLLGGAALVLAPAQSVQAQELFDGLPAPSMAQYESMWETITGLDYREESSALVVGEAVQPGEFELIAFQAETAPGNGVVTPVGTVTISESHTYQWLLPYVRIDELDDGTNDFEFSITNAMSAAAVFIDADNGVNSWAVAISGSMTVEILDG